MREAISLVVVGLFAGLFLSGCAMGQTTAYGGVFTQAKGPVAVGPNTNPNYSKMGTSQSSSILGIVGLGDSSITSAMENGGIQKIHHVDQESSGILGIYFTHKTIVYGD